MSLDIIRRNIQNRHIYTEYISKKSIREISHPYNVPVSSIFKIVKSIYICLHNNRDANIDAQFSYKLNEEEKQFIKEFIKPSQIPLTNESIYSELSKNLCTQSIKRDIKQYLKKSLHYSYKKGSYKIQRWNSKN